jgi:uncharacterized protein YbaP (TraB family)
MRISLVRRLSARSLSLAVAVVTLTWPLSAATQSKTKGFFWTATSPTTTVSFLGSIHAATADIYPLPAEIDAAFNAAAALVVELDITTVDQAQMMITVMQKGMYPAGDSLEKHVSPETMTAFREFFPKNGLEPSLATGFMQMKPGMLGSVISVLIMQQLGMSPDFGVDKHYLDLAHKPATAKRIVPLETMEEQLNLLFGQDEAHADATLRDALQDTSKAELTKLFSAWKQGDVSSVEKMVASASGKNDDAKALMEAMLYSRNDRMTAKIADMLQGKEKVFVIVGAAHMLGDRGILKQLEKRGFKVDRPELTSAK